MPPISTEQRRAGEINPSPSDWYQEWEVRMGRMRGYSLATADLRTRAASLEHKDPVLAEQLRQAAREMENSPTMKQLIAEKDAVLRQVDKRRLPPT